jgi:hypothetical protein
VNCEAIADLLGFVGGLATLLPSLHAGWLGWKAHRTAPGPHDRGGAADLKQAVSAYFDRIVLRYRPEHFFLTVVGVALITVGFGVDLFVAACNA